jgi:CBS domain-containing protein
MAQTRDHDADSSASTGSIDNIEKGWTVYDAVRHPLGNVTDVDAETGQLVVDGRSVGFGEFAVPLTAVRDARDNDVHLALAVDPTPNTEGATPRFIDPPIDRPSEPDTARPTLDVTPPQSTATTSTSTATTPTPSAVAAERGGPAPVRDEGEDARRFGRWTPYVGVLATGGIGALGYYWWRRRRRKTAWERTVDFIVDRHPGWWASAAAALPLAYYAWPSKAAPTDRLSAARRWGAMVPMDPRSRWVDAAAGHAPSSATARGLGLLGVLAAAVGAISYVATRRTGRAAPSRLGEIMTRHPQIVRPDATVAEAASMMRRFDMGAIPVCDGSRLVGMLTDRDIATRSVADGRDPLLTPVRDVMSSGVAWASEDDSVEQAARIMQEHQVRRLPIIDARKNLVGIVSLGDLAVDVDDDQLSGGTLERISEPAPPRR